MDTLVYAVWTSLSLRPDSSSFVKLLAELDTPQGIYEADEDRLKEILGSRSHDLAPLLDKDLSEAERIVAFCRKMNVGTVVFGEENYPKRLAEITNPPPVLYYRGVWQDFDRACPIAVVGTRKMTEYGKCASFNIARDLARSGALIVSGMALGVDGVAHTGALAASAPTVAVLGSGIDICYPPEHLTLAKEIVKNGCILTEYAPGTKPMPYRFPERNRIISGLSAATLVIEGREKSGALITARHAAAQGRPVYALPGNVDSTASVMPNLLIKNGAKVCTSADDLIRDFEYVYPGVLNPFKLDKQKDVNPDEFLDALKVPYRKVAEKSSLFSFGKKKRERKAKPAAQAEPAKPLAVPPQVPLSDGEKSLFDALPPDGTDVLAETLVTADRPLREVMKNLLKLEIKGLVTVLPGERVCRK